MSITTGNVEFPETVSPAAKVLYQDLMDRGVSVAGHIADGRAVLNLSPASSIDAKLQSRMDAHGAELLKLIEWNHRQRKAANAQEDAKLRELLRVDYVPENLSPELLACVGNIAKSLATVAPKLSAWLTATIKAEAERRVEKRLPPYKPLLPIHTWSYGDVGDALVAANFSLEHFDGEIGAFLKAVRKVINVWASLLLQAAGDTKPRSL